MKRPLITLALLIVTTLAIIAYRDSQIPRATATVQVHPSMITINPTEFTRSYMENHFDIILSKETKALAASFLGIEKGQQDSTIEIMDKNVSAAPIRGTDYITITAKDPDPQQAIDTANAIAKAYAQRRSESETSRAQLSLEALDEELLAQQEKVAAHHDDLQKFVQKNGSPPFHEACTPALSLKQHTYQMAKETYEQSAAMLHEMKLKQEEARTLLKQPRQPITIHEQATLTPSQP